MRNIALRRIECECSVHTPMYEHNDKQYLRLTIPEKVALIAQSSQSKVALKNTNIDNPLDGNVLTVKVPFRYRRVMCSYEGAPVQSLKRADKVRIVADFMGGWNIGNYSGYSWKLGHIKLIDPFIV